MHTILNKNILNLVVLAVLLGTSHDSADSSYSPTVVQPTVKVQVFPIDMLILASFPASYVKIGDLATFDVQSPSSTVELVFHSRISVLSFDAGSSGAIFELRVDNTASTLGRARACLHVSEVDKISTFATIIGMFSNMSQGSHTASLWISGSSGGGNLAIVNSITGVYSLVVKEYLPFGYTYMPLIQK